MKIPIAKKYKILFVSNYKIKVHDGRYPAIVTGKQIGRAHV